MGFIYDYHEDSIKAKIVEREGVYKLRIDDVQQGEIPANDKEKAKKYLQVSCTIAAKDYPQTKIFLTEGPNFNGVATAFFDTFRIPHGNWNTDEWKMLEGFMKIELKKNGEYMNMVPKFVLDENGYVRQPRPEEMALNYTPAQATQPAPQNPTF